MKRIIWILLAVLAIGSGLYAWIKLRPQPAALIEVSAGHINQIKSMVRLCSVDIYGEMTVTDTVDDRMIVAIQKQQGSISFDIEQLKVDTVGDTLRVALPREVIELKESTEPNSWQVIDTKYVGSMAIFHSDKMDASQENRAKANIHRKAVDRLYRDGTVRKARAEAVENLSRFLQTIYDSPVIVTDSTPDGSRK